MFRTLLRRLLALIPLVAVIFLMIGMQPASAEGGDPYVTVSDASCVGEQGQVSVTLYPGSQATQDVEFIILVDNVSYGDDPTITVPPATDKTVVVGNLEDGTHRFEIIANDVTIFDNPRTVSCDTAPEGQYKNPKGSLLDFCEGIVGMTASNKPIGGNLEGLQPVTFTVTFVSNEGGGVKQLDSFTLPSGEDDAFDTQRNYSPGSPGVVSLYADGVALQHLDFSDTCVVVPTTGHHPKHHGHQNSSNPNGATTLPNTGLNFNQWLLMCSVILLFVGSAMVKLSRRPVLARTKR